MFMHVSLLLAYPVEPASTSLFLKGKCSQLFKLRVRNFKLNNLAYRTGLEPAIEPYGSLN